MADDLAERIRLVIGDDPNVGEIRMSGGICFTLNGNMLVGTMKGGDLLARIGNEQEAAALALPGAARMNFTGREMKGYIFGQAGRARRQGAGGMDRHGVEICRPHATQEAGVQEKVTDKTAGEARFIHCQQKHLE